MLAHRSCPNPLSIECETNPRTKAKELTLNAGSEVGVSAGNVFDVYKVTKVIKDPETGAVLGKKTAKIGTIKVTSVEKKFSLASVIEGEGFDVGAVVREIKKG